jgi:N-acyl-L-homoserine lactone synthetase
MTMTPLCVVAVVMDVAMVALVATADWLWDQNRPNPTTTTTQITSCEIEIDHDELSQHRFLNPDVMKETDE